MEAVPGDPKGEWIRVNVDSGAAVTALPREMSDKPLKGGSGQTYRTACGRILNDEGSMRVRGVDSWNRGYTFEGRAAAIHKPQIL